MRGQSYSILDVVLMILALLVPFVGVVLVLIAYAKDDREGSRALPGPCRDRHDPLPHPHRLMSAYCTSNTVRTVEGKAQVIRCQRSPEHAGTHMAKVGHRMIKWTEAGR